MTPNERTEDPLEITGVQALPLRAPLVGRSVDQPAPGRVEGDLLITGWVLSGPGPVSRVTATAGGRLLGHVRSERPRPDLTPVFPEVPHAEQAGFRLRLTAPQLAGAGTITLAAELPEGASIPFGRLTLALPGPAVVDQTPAVRKPPLVGRRRLKRLRSEAAPRTTVTKAPAAGAALAVPKLQADPFRVVALISAYNESDIIQAILAHLHANEIESYLIDDGSTDGTGEHAARWLGRGLLGIERIEKPPDARTSWRALIQRKQELAAELGADWYIHHDADEIRESPFPTGTLRDAIQWVDGLGYNAIGFRVLQFRPVDDTFRPGDDPREHFLRWEDPAEYDMIQRKCWKAGLPGVSLVEDGGHEVRFPGRRLFPVRFLMRHYPIRGQAHGARKVLHERKGRFIQEEIDYGWHKQYDQVDSADHLFLCNPAALHPFDLQALRLEELVDADETQDRDVPPTDESTGTVRGFLEVVSQERISGWARRDGGNATPVAVDLWDGGRLITTVAADLERGDLASGPEDSGIGGFSVRTPKELLDGRPHWVWATVRGTGQALRQAPLVIQATGRVTIAGRAAAPGAGGAD